MGIGADDRLAAEHVGLAERYARDWARSHDRLGWADEAEAAAMIGLAKAVELWGGEGRFSTLLYACVRRACRDAWRAWRHQSDRSVGLLRDPSRLALVPDDAPPPADRLEYAETAARVRSAWLSFSAAARPADRDRMRAIRYLYGLPEAGARVAYHGPMDARRAARKVGRSKAWVERVDREFLERMRATLA